MAICMVEDEKSNEKGKKNNAEAISIISECEFDDFKNFSDSENTNNSNFT